MSIPITDLQYLAIANAAAALHPVDRDRFVAAVAHELTGRSIGDGSVGCAIRTAQSKFSHPEPETGPRHHEPRVEKQSHDAQ